MCTWERTFQPALNPEPRLLSGLFERVLPAVSHLYSKYIIELKYVDDLSQTVAPLSGNMSKSPVPTSS